VIGEWTLLADPGATAARYQSSTSLPATCKCRYCRNFVAARERACPPELLVLMKRLGIDITREAETSVVKTLGGGMHRYVGHFPFVGTLLEALSPSYPLPMGAGAAISFTGSPVPMTSAMRAAFAGQPLVLLRFNLVLPSVLETASAPTQRDPDPVH
jgi:hypothetical protein